MILSDKDLQLLSSMPQNDSENDRKDNDLKIGKNCTHFQNQKHSKNCFSTLVKKYRIQNLILFSWIFQNINTFGINRIIALNFNVICGQWTWGLITRLNSLE